jgi:hypothetical protein
MKVFRSFLFLLALHCFACGLNAQELNCRVTVNSQQIQGTNKKVFTTLETALNEFMTNRVWTSNVFGIEERIECNIQITISEQSSSDEFTGTLNIQARRPVFNSSYNTVMFNDVDNSFTFKYVEFEPIEFSETTYKSELSSVMAYYAYIILGLDFDSFSLMGGTEFYKKAESIVNYAQSSTNKGWKAFDSKNNKNRYWLVKNMLDSKYEPVREFLYRYHIKGLDVLDSKPTEACAEIEEDLLLLQKVYREKPDPYLNPLQMIFDTKSDEIVNVFSEAFPDQKNRVYTIMKEIDMANSSTYEKLTKTN